MYNHITYAYLYAYVYVYVFFIYDNPYAYTQGVYMYNKGPAFG